MNPQELEKNKNKGKKPKRNNSSETATSVDVEVLGPDSKSTPGKYRKIDSTEKMIRSRISIARERFLGY